MKTTLTVEQETLRNLNLIKYAMAVDTLDDVINRLIVNYRKSKEETKDGN